MSNPYLFDRVPTLEELLPQTGGRPGVTYAMVATSNLRKAQEQGWERLAGNTPIWTVEGPKGTVDFELWGRGKPIPGQDPNSSRCLCYVDKSIREDTGHTFSEASEEQ